MDVANQDLLTCPLATFAVAISNGSFTSIRDIHLLATNVRLARKRPSPSSFALPALPLD
jgi:hypothetical protein